MEIIARDRSLLYRDGGQRGAPAARQVHDRFHLINNLTEAIEADAQRINRLKVIKRQMYRRAGFELPKARVMPFVEAQLAEG